MRKNGYIYHVPRTGGNSTYKWFEMLSRQGHTRLWNDGHSHFRSREQLAKKFAAQAKKKDGIILKPEDLITITWLRDPVAHSVSIHTYQKRRGGGAKKFRGYDPDFSKWIRRKGSPGSFVGFFSSDGKLETAIKNMSTIDFIGFTDYFNSDMNKMMKVFGLNLKYNNKKINSSTGQFKPSAADIKYLKERRKIDYALVNEFRKRRGLSPY
jgi:hypothetical protein